MFFNSNKKEVILTNKEKSAYTSLENRPGYTIKLRASSMSMSNYCLYDLAGSPLCLWPRGVIDGLVAKNKLSINQDGTFKTLK